MQNQSIPVILISWSVLVKYAIVSAINLAILLVGIAIGVMLAPHIEKTASASHRPDIQVQSAPAAPTQATATVSPKITTVQPSMTTGTVAIYLILGHHMQADELVVNGYDILKLQNAELQLLSKFVPPAEIQKVVSDSRASETFTIQQTPPAK